MQQTEHNYSLENWCFLALGNLFSWYLSRSLMSFGLGHHVSLEAKLYIMHENKGTHVLVTGYVTNNVPWKTTMVPNQFNGYF